MGELKYIVFLKDGHEDFIIFSKLQVHSDFNHYNVVGAGFCRMLSKDGDIMFKCYGKSVSLNVESRKELDEDVLNQEDL